MRTVTLMIEVDDESDPIESLAGVSGSMMSEVPADAAYGLIAGVLEGLIRNDLYQRERDANPFGEDAHAREASELAARLMLVDIVMHLPTTQATGLSVEFPLE